MRRLVGCGPKRTVKNPCVYPKMTVAVVPMVSVAPRTADVSGHRWKAGTWYWMPSPRLAGVSTHTRFISRGSTEVLLRCDAPGAKRRSDVARELCGAAECYWSSWIASLVPRVPQVPAKHHRHSRGANGMSNVRMVPASRVRKPARKTSRLNSAARAWLLPRKHYNGEIELTMPPQGCFDGQCAVPVPGG